MNSSMQIARATESITILPGSGFTELNSAATGSTYYQLYIHGCGPGQGNTYRKPGREDDAVTVNSLPGMNDILVYPNPNNGNFILSSRSENLKDIYVYNVLGKLVYSQANTTMTKLEIDISDEPKGLYIIKVIEGNEVQTLKVINQ